MAHIITGVIGAGVLSLAWSMSQLGWVAGPVAMVVFAAITLLSTVLLCECYRSPDPEFGLTRNHSYMEAVNFYLGESIIHLDIYWQFGMVVDTYIFLFPFYFQLSPISY